MASTCGPQKLARLQGLMALIMARSKLPGHPTPVIVSDKHGKAKWTVSIPPNAKFPLAAEEYTSICDKCVDVANRVDILRRRSSGGIHSLSMGAISSINKSHKPKSAAERMQTFDNNFIDVHEAEEAGYLTGSVSIATLMNQQADNNDDGNIVGEEDTLSARRAQKPVCSRSLTFVLASTDAGLGRTLMLLWMAYAQAQAEGRGFFIDDTRWAYGRYAQIFAPPPSPNCRPPLRHEMLPCPHQARHLVMTVDTASRFILAENDDGAEDITPEHTAHLFDLAYKGYEALFHLNVDDAKHVAKRVKEIKAEAAGEKLSSNADSSKKEHGAIVGVHVRRGDRRPAEFQYRDSYLPLNLYADRATGEIAASAHARGKGSFPSSLPSVMVLATDDPMVYQAEEFAGATRAQKHIRLANKAVTEPPVPQRGVLHKFVDEAFGWEGGFYAAMFWNLGGAASPAPDTVPVAAEALRIRSLVGRAYMMDLAVLAESSDQVVCAVSATGCRLLAVMMGRDKALKQGRWINIDGDYGWWAADF
ncbi:hypothetical protein SEPCBS119000_006203 [Sporothrix epigloea]|uniref:Uncharacterized protein n=1 Tax=Sporothrix epigloea TaxID=1892477 RepID=A0ABP0E3Q2_9PEZI